MDRHPRKAAGNRPDYAIPHILGAAAPPVAKRVDARPLRFPGYDGRGSRLQSAQTPRISFLPFLGVGHGGGTEASLRLARPKR